MSPVLMGELLAVTCLAALVAGWIIYPLGLAVAARMISVRSRPGPSAGSPSVSVVVATREPPEVVARRLENLLASDYAGPLEIVISVDHRSAHGLAGYERVTGNNASVVRGDPPGGKAAALNAGLRTASGAIVVLADSHQAYEPTAISRLVQAFDEPRVGGVTGGYRLKAEGHELLRWFWQYETMLRRLESRVHSVVAVTGAIYAIRRHLWTPLRDNVICDDLFVPARIVRAGYRVVLQPDAVADDRRTFTKEQQLSRKVRTLTGMIQFCAWEPWALVPIRNPIWIQFVSHKLLRLATPLLVLGVLAGTLPAFVRYSDILWLPLLAALVCALLAVLLRPSTIGQVAWVVRLLGAPLQAFSNALRGDWDVWKPTDTGASTVAADGS